MSQGAMIDLQQQINEDLRKLRESRPDLYAGSGTRLGGWDVDVPSDDYWLDVRIGRQRSRVTDWDD